jgi:hypothetical protein
LIKQGRMTEAGVARVREAKATGEWRAAALREDTTNIPEGLRHALKANSQAQRNFDRLAPSRKRQYIYWITSAKTDKTRQRRIQETVKLVAETGQLDAAHHNDGGDTTAMSIGFFTEEEYQPTETAVLVTLGTKQPLWEALTQFIADNYPIPGEWKFGGQNYGWNLWYRKSGKTLVTLYPQKGFFVAQIVLGKDQVEQASDLKLGKNVVTVLTKTPQLHDGRWLFIKVKTARDVKDVQQLLQVKRQPRPQKQA